VPHPCDASVRRTSFQCPIAGDHPLDHEESLNHCNLAGGSALAGGRILRVPHLSRRATGGDFEFRITFSSYSSRNSVYSPALAHESCVPWRQQSNRPIRGRFLSETIPGFARSNPSCSLSEDARAGCHGANPERTAASPRNPCLA